MTTKRYSPRETPYAEMIALPDGEYVRHDDYVALELHNEYLLARLRKQGEQLDAVGAGGVSGQPITSQRRGEPVACFKCGHVKHGGECVNVAPQPADPVVKESLTAPDGWQLMPKDPTQEMFYSCEHIFDHGNSGESPFEFFDRKYKDILEAAPKFGE